MRNYPEFNFPAFMKTTAKLRRQGHLVFNPAERDIAAGVSVKTPKQMAKAAARGLAHYMQFDLVEVCKADAVVVLPEWWNSVGARMEVAVGHRLGKRILGTDLKPIPWWAIFSSKLLDLFY